MIIYYQKSYIKLIKLHKSNNIYKMQKYKMYNITKYLYNIGVEVYLWKNI